METSSIKDRKLILFDGVCNLCNGAVQFVLQHDSKQVFSFASLQSPLGKRLTEQTGLSGKLNTIVFIVHGQVYTHSDAVLKIAKHLPAWSWLSVFWFVPKFLRDAIYTFVAANRYKIFGKREACWLPTPELKSRFLE